jgi:hypothetical protein
MKNIIFYILNVPAFIVLIFLAPYISCYYLKYNLSLPRGFSPENMISMELAGLLLFPIIGSFNLTGSKQHMLTIIGWIYIASFTLLLWSICFTLIQE